jgi:EmrB/QacA subfamily drug resistance transporter
VADLEGMTTPVTRRASLVVICGILALTFLDTTVVSVALGDIQTNLHLGVTGLQWVVDAYAVAFASLMLTGGTLGDRYGRRRIMLSGVALFAAASLLGALSPSGNLLIVSRALMGIGAAASEPGTLSVLRQIYPEHRGRARALAVWAAVSCLGLALGPLLGGVLIELWDWRAIFWLNVVAGVVLFVTARRFVPETADPEHAQLDLPGQAYVIVGIGSLVVALIEGERAGYGHGAIVALFVVAAGCLSLFIRRELRTPVPMIDLRYFRDRRFNASLAVAFAAYFGTFSIFFFTALYLEEVVDYSGYRTALLFLPMTVLMVTGALAGGRLVVRRHGRWTMAAGAMIAAIGIVASEPLIDATPNFAALMVTLAVTGLGMGIAMVPVTSVVLDVVPRHHSGMAASATNTARQLGVVFGVAILGALVDGQLRASITRRLDQLHVPQFLQDPIIRAYENGDLSGNGGGITSNPLIQRFVDQVRGAAYVAFHSGLSTALFISALLITAAALFAAYALGREYPQHECT